MKRIIWICLAAIAIAVGAFAFEIGSTGGGHDGTVPCSKGWSFSDAIGACVSDAPRKATVQTVACDSTHVYDGCTLSLNGPRWANTGQALSFSSAARDVLCSTTISGAKYVSTGYPASSKWRKAIDGLFSANFLSQGSQDAAWLSVHDALFATTVSGAKYCAARAKYAGGKWDQAFSTIATLETYLQQNPLVTQPPSPSVSGTLTVTTG